MHASRCQAQSGMSWDAAIAARAAANASDVDAPSRVARRRCHDDDGNDAAERTRSAERRHPLVQAMTEALRSLMPTDAKASDSEEVKDSAAAFAHELVDALRDTGGRHHGWHHGYDDLAQRLDKLAAKLEQPAAAPANAPASNGSTSALSASLTSTSLNVSVDANGTSASLSVTSIELQVSTQSAGAAQATDAAPTKAESPLLAAFRKMMTALQPAGGSASAPASDTSDTSKLSAFLRQLASALRGGEAAGGDTAAAPSPASGSLLSLAA